MQTVLIVDDEEAALETMSDALSNQGYEIITTSSGKEALTIMQDRPVDVVLTDLKMPDVDGMEILRIAKDMDPQAQVIMITGYGSIEKAVRAMRAGAADFIEKPVLSLAAFREKVKKALGEQ